MKAPLRKSSILQELEESGSITVIDAAERFSVSAMTIRRDLVDLERAGLVRKIHGGAVVGRGRSYEPPLMIRSAEATEVKERIGLTTARLVAEGDSIAIDTGSTCMQVARHLKGRRNLTVVTSSLQVADILIDEPDIRLIVTGGVVRPGEGSLTGELARHAYSELSVDRIILACGGLDANFGVSEYNWDDTLVKKAMIRSAKEVILVADSHKFDHVAFARICGLDEVDKLVTEDEPQGELAENLHKAGVRIVVANGSEEGYLVE